MDSAGASNQLEGKLTLADLKVRDNESQKIFSLWYSGINKCCGQTHSNTKMGKSELDPLLANDGLWLSSHDEEKMYTDAQSMPSESACNMLLQILAPFLLAGLGTVMAGMLLDIVQVNMAGIKAHKVCEFKCQSEIFVGGSIGTCFGT